MPQGLFGFFTPRDISDAGSDHPRLAAGQGDQPHFTRNDLPVGPPVQPFKNGPLAIEGLCDFFDGNFFRRLAVRLQGWTELYGTAFQKGFAVELKQLKGIVVGIKKRIGINVQHNDCFGRMFDQCLEAGFTFAERC